MPALGRLELGEDGGFTDVPGGSWMKQATDSAKSFGIISGFDDGTFKPNDALTKEQALAIAARTLSIEMKYRDVSPDSTLSAFSDASSISSSMRADVAKAYKAGLFLKSATGRINPQANITRAEAAVMLRQLFSNLWL
jgi:hypothetical protein